MDDARSSDPLERLLEDSWESRSQRASRRELMLETSAAALFLAVAAPLAASALATHRVDLGLGRDAGRAVRAGRRLDPVPDRRRLRRAVLRDARADAAAAAAADRAAVHGHRPGHGERRRAGRPDACRPSTCWSRFRTPGTPSGPALVFALFGTRTACWRWPPSTWPRSWPAAFSTSAPPLCGRRPRSASRRSSSSASWRWCG